MSEMKAKAEDRPVATSAAGSASKIKRIATAGIALGAVAIFSVGLWFAYDQGIKKGQKGAPPLIRAEGPVKVVPAEPGGMQVPNQDMRIYNRGGANEPPAVEKVMPQPERALPQTSSQTAASAARPAAPSNGVQSLPIPAAPQAAPVAPVRPQPQTAKAPEPAKTEAPKTEPAPAPAPLPPVGSAALPDQPAAAEAQSAAPALTPVAPKPQTLTPARPAPATAAAPKPTAQPAPAPARAATGSGGVRVQVSAQRDQAAAQAAWTKVQKKLPDVFSGMNANYERVDLGEKGIYFRVQAGPFPDRAAAQAACDRLKSVGEGCIIVGR